MNNGYNLALQEGIDFQINRGHWLPRKLGVAYLALGRTLYCRETNAPVPKHEYLHIVQFHKYGWTRVVLHYLYHVARNYCRLRSFGAAFRAVPFEVEARDYEAGQWDKDVVAEKISTRKAK